MTREKDGPSLRLDPNTKIYSVRFSRDEGGPKARRYDLSCRTRDRIAAGIEANRLYQEVMSGRFEQKLPTLSTSLTISSLLEPFITHVAATVAPDTVRLYRIHMKLFIREFEDQVRHLNPDRVLTFTEVRMGQVLRSTVVHELCSLRNFVAWCERKNYVRIAFVIRVPDFRSKGTPDPKKHKRKPVALDRTEVRAIIDRLPEKSRGRCEADRHWVKPYFDILWETGLRPTTVQRLRVPEHWRPGSKQLNITADIDKESYGRPVDMTERAIAVFEKVCPTSGLIFGEHDYREQVKKASKLAAADGALDQWKAPDVSPYDWRHGRITELVDAAGLVGAAFLAGHKNVATTARYVNKEMKEGKRALEMTEAAAAKRLAEAAAQGTKQSE